MTRSSGPLLIEGNGKPGVLMPHFRMLPAAEINALAAYLESLQ